jgi:DNA-binding NarL/FixJ family response regulator
MKPKPVYRVLVYDRAAMVRQEAMEALRNNCEFHVVEEAIDTHDCVAKAIELKPDLVLMDVGAPEPDGVDATKQILLSAAGTKVLACSSDSEWETVDRMFAAGACGYVVKLPLYDELVRAARTVLAGGHYLSLKLLQPAE